VWWYRRKDVNKLIRVTAHSQHRHSIASRWRVSRRAWWSTVIQRLQSVQNAAVRLTYNIRRFKHILQMFWPVFTRYVFESGSLSGSSCLDISSSPRHCASATLPGSPVSPMFQPGVGFERRLPTNSTVPAFRLSTVGARVFPTAGACTWTVCSAGCDLCAIIDCFRQLPKTVPFRRYL